MLQKKVADQRYLRFVQVADRIHLSDKVDKGIYDVLL